MTDIMLGARDLVLKTKTNKTTNIDLMTWNINYKLNINLSISVLETNKFPTKVPKWQYGDETKTCKSSSQIIPRTGWGECLQLLAPSSGKMNNCTPQWSETGLSTKVPASTCSGAGDQHKLDSSFVCVCVCLCVSVCKQCMHLSVLFVLTRQRI